MKVFAIAAAALACACGGNGTAGVTGPSSANPANPPSGNGVAPGTAVFSLSPIDIADLSEIVPWGI